MGIKCNVNPGNLIMKGKNINRSYLIETLISIQLLKSKHSYKLF